MCATGCDSAHISTREVEVVAGSQAETNTICMGDSFSEKKKSIPDKTTIRKKATLPTKATVNCILEWEAQLNLQVPCPRSQPSARGKCVVKMHLHLAQTGFSFLAALS